MENRIRKFLKSKNSKSNKKSNKDKNLLIEDHKSNIIKIIEKEDYKDIKDLQLLRKEKTKIIEKKKSEEKKMKGQTKFLQKFIKNIIRDYIDNEDNNTPVLSNRSKNFKKAITKKYEEENKNFSNDGKYFKKNEKNLIENVNESEEENEEIKLGDSNSVVKITQSPKKRLLNNFENEIENNQEILNPRKIIKFQNIYDSLSEGECESDDIEGTFVINENSDFKFTWDIIMFICILYSCIVEPYCITFQLTTFLHFDVILDIIYILDMMFNLFQPFYRDDKVIRNHNKIMQNYIKGWLFFDLISSVPTSLIVVIDKSFLNHPFYKYFKWLRILKTIHIMKNDSIGHRLDNLSLSNDSSINRTTKFGLLLLLLIHISTCIWVYIGYSMSDTGISWLINYNFIDLDPGDIYIASIYFNLVTLFTIGYGDICSKTSYERMYNILFMFIGVMAFSFAVSSLSTIFSRTGESQKRINNKLEVLGDIDRKFKLSYKIHSKIKRFILNQFKSSTTHLEKYDMLESLPQSLKKEIVLGIMKANRKDINEIDFFKDDDRDFIVFVVPLLKSVRISKSDTLIAKGDILDEMYIVLKGVLSVRIDKFYKNLEISRITKNKHFGEVFMYLNKNCPYFVKCKTTFCELFSLHKEEFTKIKISFNKNILQVLRNSCETLETMEKTKNAVIELFDHGVPLKEIKQKIKIMNLFLLQKNFDLYYSKNIALEDPEEFILSNDIKDIIKFLNNEISHKDYTNCLINNNKYTSEGFQFSSMKDIKAKIDDEENSDNILKKRKVIRNLNKDDQNKNNSQILNLDIKLKDKLVDYEREFSNNNLSDNLTKNILKPKISDKKCSFRQSQSDQKESNVPTRKSDCNLNYKHLNKIFDIGPTNEKVIPSHKREIITSKNLDGKQHSLLLDDQIIKNIKNNLSNEKVSPSPKMNIVINKNLDGKMPSILEEEIISDIKKSHNISDFENNLHSHNNINNTYNFFTVLNYDNKNPINTNLQRKDSVQSVTNLDKSENKNKGFIKDELSICQNFSYVYSKNELKIPNTKFNERNTQKLNTVFGNFMSDIDKISKIKYEKDNTNDTNTNENTNVQKYSSKKIEENELETKNLLKTDDELRNENIKISENNPFKICLKPVDKNSKRKITEILFKNKMKETIIKNTSSDKAKEAQQFEPVGRNPSHKLTDLIFNSKLKETNIKNLIFGKANEDQQVDVNPNKNRRVSVTKEKLFDKVNSGLLMNELFKMDQVFIMQNLNKFINDAEKSKKTEMICLKKLDKMLNFLKSKPKVLEK